MADDLTVRQMREDERDVVREVHRRSFNVPRKLHESLPVPPAETIRVAELGGQVVGALRFHRIAHFFGGRPVPAAGIGGVAVTPEARGHRVAERLMVSTLRELRRDGIAISTLYPATVPVYRRCGYEYFGFRIRYRAPLDALPRSAGLECAAFTDDDRDEIAACYRAWASARNGLIDRPAEWWTRILTSIEPDEDVYRTCVREDGRITGYLVFTQARRGDSHWEFDLDCRDFVWTTPAAASALLSYAGRHRSIGRDIVWTGGANDTMSFLLPEQDAVHDGWFRQMVRLVDVPAAFEARGYPAHVEAAVELRVDDPSIEENAGGWRVDVSGGTAKVAPASRASASVDVRTLAAIWAGMLTASDARRLGSLDATDAEVETLDELFRGPTPWVNDWF